MLKEKKNTVPLFRSRVRVRLEACLAALDRMSPDETRERIDNLHGDSSEWLPN